MDFSFLVGGTNENDEKSSAATPTIADEANEPLHIDAPLYPFSKTVAACVWKWMASRRISKTIEMRRQQLVRKTFVQDEEEQKKNELIVDELNKKFTDEEMAQICLIQRNIRFWLAIKAMMRKKNYQVAGVGAIHVVQAVMRRYLTQQKFMKKLVFVTHRDQKFARFCNLLREKPMKGTKPEADYPLKVFMYSRQKGDKSRRRLFIDDKTNSLLCWKINPYTTRHFELRRIYAIAKGQSGTYYVSQPDNKSLCLHLLGTGDVKLDFEFEKVDTFKHFFDGFERLIALYNGPTSFYTDSFGVPRRSGPSVIEYAATDKPSRGFKSEADENRYRSALHALRMEYELWEEKYKDEIENYQDERRKIRLAMSSGVLVDSNELAAAKAEEEEKYMEQISLHGSSLATEEVHKSRGVSERMTDESIYSQDDPEIKAGKRNHSLSQKRTSLDKAGEAIGLWDSTFWRPKDLFGYTGGTNDGYNNGTGDLVVGTTSGILQRRSIEEMRRVAAANKTADNDDDSSEALSVYEMPINDKIYLVTDDVNGVIYELAKDENGEMGLGDEVGTIKDGKIKFADEDSELDVLYTENKKDTKVSDNGWLGGWFGWQSSAPSDEVEPQEEDSKSHHSLYEHTINGTTYFITDLQNGQIFPQILSSEGVEEVGTEPIGYFDNGVPIFPLKAGDLESKEDAASGAGETSAKPKRRSILGRIFGGRNK